MNVSKKDLNEAVSKGIIFEDQVNLLWDFLNSKYKDKPKFDLVHVLYYFGALIIIFALAFFINVAWESLGGIGIFIIAILYIICFILAGKTLWFKKELKIPGGLLFTIAVCLVPLAVYGLEKYFNIWPQGNASSYKDFHIWVRGNWIIMEIATIIAGSIMLKFIKFPFITLPIAYSAWYLSMDLTPIFFGKNSFSWDERRWVSLWFGLIMIIISYFIDQKTEEDFSFWLYLFGTTAFWGGLSSMNSNTEIGKFIYFLINLFFMFIAILISRKIFIIYGSFGVLYYFSYLAWKIFKDSFFFPVIMAMVGIFIIFIGVKYQKNQNKIKEFVENIIPDSFKRFLPQNRI